MIAIIGAMQAEVFAIKQLMTNTSEETIAKLKFIKGKLAGKDVVLVQSGIGKTLSALTTTVLATNFNLKLVINVGSAGGISHKVKTLDVVVSEKVAQSDFDLTAFGYKQDFSEPRIAFKADQRLIHKLKSLNLENVYFGDIVSSDTFISTKKQADKLLVNFKTALCADMEAGSIAMTLSHFEIPFIVIRSISDVVGSDQGNALEFKEYLKLASKKSAAITNKLVESL